MKTRANLKQFIKFASTGVLAFIVDFLLLNFLFYILGLKTYLSIDLSFIKLSISVANMISTLVSIILIYIINSRWTFKLNAQTSANQTTKFTIVIIFNYIISNILFGFFVNLGLVEPLTKILVIGLQACWTFFLYKFFVFNQAVKVKLR